MDDRSFVGVAALRQLKAQCMCISSVLSRGGFGSQDVLWQNGRTSNGALFTVCGGSGRVIPYGGDGHSRCGYGG